MGTWQGNVNPYPINVSSIVSGTLTIPIPSGSIVTSGTWTVSGIPSGPYFQVSVTSNGATSFSGNGSFPFTSNDISNINAGGTWNWISEYYEPINYSVYITVSLTGNFPPPPSPIPPLTSPSWGTNSHYTVVLKLVGVMKGDECKVNGKAIFVYQDVSNQDFPMAYQFELPDQFKWLSISCGLFNLGGATGNQQVNMRVYKGRILTPNTWAYGSDVPPDPEVTPLFTQIAVAPVIIPWEGDLVGYLKFTSYNSSAPANSQLELLIQPFNQ